MKAFLTFISSGWVLGCVLSFIPSMVLADSAETADGLATRLSNLRSEVESLSQELGQRQGDYRAQLQGYARQEADLALEARRGTTTIAKLKLAIEKKLEANNAKAESAKVLDPILKKTAVTLSNHISTGLPFKRTQRVEAVTSLVDKRERGEITATQAMNRLWALMEDELRMQRESVMHRQEIQLNGNAVLADVLRVGMVMMFYRIKNQSVGYAVEHDGDWRFQTSNDPEVNKQIEHAFLQFSKQVRVGAFVL
ncbi:MAG: DUF3450 family protein, partial [Bradymonadia bacterium]